jgi:hypothetical protein
MIQHEDELRDKVIGWFLTLNGLLFAALAFAWQHAPHLVYVLALIGGIAAVSWRAQMMVSKFAIEDLRNLGCSEDHLPLVGMTSERLRERGASCLVRQLYGWRTLPPLIGLAWVGVVAVRIFWP